MRFIDLFAGLGGFHQALRKLGHECVFASEIDRELRSVYEQNFGLIPSGDIRSVPVHGIPPHDILCAGFPCQPFSKAGGQQGLDDPRWGDLFAHALKILRYHQPKYLMLENVLNLARHDKRQTWAKMEAQLQDMGYKVEMQILSPHRFGIPQIRERLFIVGSLDPSVFINFKWPEAEASSGEVTIESVLDNNPHDARRLTRQVRRCLDVWQSFLRTFPVESKLPSFPIWTMEFGADYPFDGTTPHAIGYNELRKYKGSHGRPLANESDDSIMFALPSYARSAQLQFPSWKAQFIRQNRGLYQEHKSWIDDWLDNIVEFPPSLQKFEWNCQGEERGIWQYVIQFRASGVRVKRRSTAPSLIAMTTTQVPIIAWEQRYMTVRECARLQSMGDLKHFPHSATKAFSALGNAVNVDLVTWVAEALLSHETYGAGRKLCVRL